MRKGICGSGYSHQVGADSGGRGSRPKAEGAAHGPLMVPGQSLRQNSNSDPVSTRNTKFLSINRKLQTEVDKIPTWITSSC